VAKEDDGDDEIKGILQVFRVFKLARIFKLARYKPLNGNFPRFGENREMENISRGPPSEILSLFIRTEASMQEITVARLQRKRVQTPLSSSFKHISVRVSLWTVKIFLAQH
jgi:hypothetical protein